MSNSWVATEVIKDTAGVSVLTGVADVVSGKFRITAGGSTKMRIDAVVSAVTGTVDIRLEHSSDGITWETAATNAGVSVTTESILILDTASTTNLPLKHLGRIVVDTTGVGTVTVDSIKVMQPN